MVTTQGRGVAVATWPGELFLLFRDNILSVVNFWTRRTYVPVSTPFGTHKTVSYILKVCSYLCVCSSSS